MLKIAVVGAGVVAISCGIALSAAAGPDDEITLYDPSPLSGASVGNAGCIALSEVLPISMPGLWKALPGMLMRPNGPLAVRWAYLPRIGPWALRFFLAGRRSRVESIADALAELLGSAEGDTKAAIQRAGLDDLVHWNGALFVHSDVGALRASRREWAMKRARGIAFEELDGDELREKEPALGPRAAGGYFVPGWAHLSDPQAYVEGLLASLLSGGACLVREEVMNIASVAGGVELTAAGALKGRFDHVVVAAGARSKALCRCLGLRIPLDTERGYNTTLPQPGVSLRRPVCIAEAGYFMTPMSAGLRVGGGVELGGLDAPPNWRRAEAMLRDAERALPDLDTNGGRRWMGFRPSMPDSLPVIGRAPGHPRVVLAFGHGHLGLTLAATTGRIVADIVHERQPTLDIRPFEADRFSRQRPTTTRMN